jgi:hypothetical protein
MVHGLPLLLFKLVAGDKVTIRMKTRTTLSRKRKPTPPSGPSSRAARLVYRVFHHEARFDLRTESRHFRKNALPFTRDFNGYGAGDEAVDYLRQFTLLCPNGDGLNYCQYYGCYRLIVNLASQHARAFRGYLLGPDKDPLTDSQIARLLHIPAKEMTRMLKRFVSVKLLERVELPEFDLSLNDEPAEGDRSSSDAGVKAGQSQPRAHAKRSRAQSRAQVRSPYLNGNGKTANDKKKSKATLGLSASGCKGKDNDNSQAEVKVQGESQGEAEGQAQAQAQRQSAEPCPPTTPPLAEQPKDVDVSGGHTVTSASPPASFSQGQSRSGLTYGRRVYLALGHTWDIDSNEATREITSVAAVHDEVCRRLAGLPPEMVDGILARALREAPKIAKRKSTRRRGAVFNSLLDKLCAAARGGGVK